MNQDTKKKIIIGLSIGVSLGVAVIAAIFIKNKLQQKKFEPLARETMIQILKRARKQNYGFLKKVTFVASKIIAEMRMNKPDLKMIKSLIQSPQSQLKVQQSFENNYQQVCKSNNADYSHFQQSLLFYTKIQDQQIQKLVDQIQKDYQISLNGKLPEIKVTVPPSLTKQRLIQITKKLSLKRYLLQIDIFRKIRGKNQQQLKNPQLLKSIPSPEEEQQKILQQQGVGTSNEPASAVYSAGITKFKNDVNFKQNLQKIQRHNAKIFGKYQAKIQQNKITQNQLNQLEDQLIYSDWS